MRKIKPKTMVFAVFTMIAIGFVGFKLITVGYRKAVKIELAPGTVRLSDYVGQEVKLLCRYVETTGAAYQTYAVETSPDVYTLFVTPKTDGYVGEFKRSSIPQQGIIIENENIGPLVFVDDRLSDYGSNFYIIKGTLVVKQYTETYYEYCIVINSWDIVYPISNGIGEDARPPEKQGRLSPRDFLWRIGFLLG